RRARGGPAPGLTRTPEPFRFHVSEDLFTSLDLHGQGVWRSVYHPRIEAAMLSVWSLDAWIAQKAKYAGGTLDLLLREGHLWRPGLPWRMRLHYAATFWGYLSAIPLLVLIAAPVVTMTTGIAPVRAYAADFFGHLVPLLLCAEGAMVLGAKGHDMHQGRLQGVATLPVTLRALWAALCGERTRFRPTPKRLGAAGGLRAVPWHAAALAIFGAAAALGIMRFGLGHPGFGVGLMVVNLFWLAWNAAPFVKVLRAARWNPVDAWNEEAAHVAH
ncbi:MAG: glycosyltransferase family 2 protein, partial [Shimia sp.]